MAPNHPVPRVLGRPECPDTASIKDPEAFNAHSYVGTEFVAPSAYSLSRPWRRHCARRAKLDRLPARVLPSGQGAVADVPRLVPALPGKGIRRGQPELLLRAPSPA